MGPPGALWSWFTREVETGLLVRSGPRRLDRGLCDVSRTWTQISVENKFFGANDLREVGR